MKPDGHDAPFTYQGGLSAREISALLVTAFEGGSNFWAHKAEAIGWMRPEGHTTPWYADEAFIAASDFKFELTFDGKDDDEGSGASKMVIGKNEIIAGLIAMIHEAPNTIGKVISEDYDAYDADNFLQCVVFGKIIYG